MRKDYLICLCQCLCKKEKTEMQSPNSRKIEFKKNLNNSRLKITFLLEQNINSNLVNMLFCRMPLSDNHTKLVYVILITYFCEI